MPYILRDYQEQASDAAVAFFNNTRSERNGILVLPTGAGKSLVIADIAKRMRQNVLVLQPSKEILAQNYAKYRSYGMDNCSIYSASFNSKEISEVTFATIGSIMAHIDDFDHFKAIIIDECFPYKQFVSTELGKKRIGYLYKLYMQGKPLPKVLSYNENTGEIEANKIVDVRCNGVKEVMELSFSGNLRLKITKGHPLLTLTGWKSAGELKTGDAVLSAYTTGSHVRIPNTDQEEFLLGSIVGDGSLDKSRKTLNINRFRFIHCEKQKEYLEWKAQMLGCTDKVQRIEDNGISKKPAYKFSSEVMYINDTKCTKKYAIENLTQKSLSIIYMDDGHLARKQNGATICCVAESEELTNLLAKKMQRLGIDCCARKSRSSSSGKVYNYIAIRTKGIKVLCSLIASYVHPSMKYKIIDEYKSQVGAYKWKNTYKHFGCSVLLEKRCADNEMVYNMEVENAHTYIVTSRRYDKKHKTFDNGLIVHNCHNVNPVEGQYATFIRKVRRKVLGLTATPYRLSTAQGIETKDKGFMPNGSFKSSDYFIDDFHPMPGVRMVNACILKFLTRTRPRIFHDVLYEVSIQTLLQRGYLAKLRYFDMTTIDTSRVRRNSTGRDYDEQSLSDEFSRCGMGNQLANIVKRLLHPKNGVPRKGILVFTQFITESEQLQREIEGVEIVTGATKKKERDRILEDFKSGKIKVLANVGVLTCLSNDTEILTRNKGWAGIDDIEEFDLVAQYDEYTEEISFAHPIRIVKKEFKENFISIEGRYMNFKVTHDHNMIYRKRGVWKIGNPIRCKALELASVKNPYIPVSGFAHSDLIAVQQEKRCTDKRFLATNSYNYRKKGMNHDEALKTAKQMLERRNLRRYKNPNELSLDECRFIGFWLGDGCVVDNKEGKRYSLSQSYCNPNMILWVEELLNKCGIHYNRQFYKGKPEHILGRKCNVSDHVTYNLAIGTGGHKQSVESNLYSLLPYLHKQGSDLYWGLSREQFFCIMEGYFKANGYHGNNKDYKGQRSVGANKELFDLLQAIGVCRGYRVSVTEIKPRAHTKKKLYRISLGDYRYHQMVNDKAIIIPNTSKEQVWCVTMPKGTIVTRRKGKVTIMGNCGFDYPELDTVVMARPTMSLAMWYQIVGRAIRPFPGKDGWVVDLGENIKRFGRVDDLSLRMDKPGEYYISGVVNGQYKQLTNKYF